MGKEEEVIGNPFQDVGPVLHARIVAYMSLLTSQDREVGVPLGIPQKSLEDDTCL